MRWLPLVALCAGLVVGLTPLRLSPVCSQEKKNISQVGGKPLEFWIEQIRSKDQSKAENAIRTVLAFGPERAYYAVPVMLDRMRKIPASTIDTSIRVNGAIAVGQVLASHREADPKVIKDAVTILKRYLEDNQSIVRFRAAEALGRIGPEARDAIPQVISVAKDYSTFETRQAATLALGLIGRDDKNGPSPAILAALDTSLRDGSYQVRIAAIQAYGAFQYLPTNPGARAVMLKSLETTAHKDTEPAVQLWGHMALIGIHGKFARADLDPVIKMLGHSDIIVRAQAAQALGALGDKGKAAVPSLSKTLTDPDTSVRGWAIWALGKIGPPAADALPRLRFMSTDMTQPESIRELAEVAIEGIAPKK